MSACQKTISHDELCQIPGIGKKMSKALHQVGISKIKDLKGKKPEALFDDYCNAVGMQVDRCVLYVFRCAVYYASTQDHDPECLQWWNWSDENIQHRN